MYVQAMQATRTELVPGPAAAVLAVAVVAVVVLRGSVITYASNLRVRSISRKRMFGTSMNDDCDDDGDVNAADTLM